jgi:Rhs element Vgr protein
MADESKSPQADKQIQIDTAIGKDAVFAVGISGQEAISQPYLYKLSLISRNRDIRPDQMLGTQVGIRVKISDKLGYRGMHGFVMGFAAGDLHPKRHEFRTYTMRVAPWLSQLDQGTNFRIFQDVTVLQILQRVLDDAIKIRFAGTTSTGQYYRMRILCGPDYPSIDYCVQYHETDYNFVSRLMAQHGIHFFFEQTDMSHTMVIVDSVPYTHVKQNPASFHASADSRSIIGSWAHAYDSRLKEWRARDFEYRSNPPILDKRTLTVVPELAKGYTGRNLEYPGGAATLTNPGEESEYLGRLTRYRMQEEETRYEVFTGTSEAVTYEAGRQLRVIGDPKHDKDIRVQAEEEKEYLLTQVSFTCTEPHYTDDSAFETIINILRTGILGGATAAGDMLTKDQTKNLPNVNKVIDNLPSIPGLARTFGTGFAGPLPALILGFAEPIIDKLRNLPIIGGLIGLIFPKPPEPPPFTNSFVCVPVVSGRQYRAPSVATKPRVQGPQTAIVFGPTDHDVHTDELGRILVKFHWDRTRPGEEVPETSSCWLRVAQGWAGSRFGMQYIPRVGQEVVVDFLDGDPDRPLVTASVFNAVQKHPYELTKYRLQSGIKTRTIPLGEDEADKFHMFRFDDTAGAEQVLLRSQKRTDIRTFGSHFETDGGSRNIHVGWKDKDSDKQGGDYNITVGNDHQIHIQGGRYDRIEKKLNETVVGDVVLDHQANQAVMVKSKAELNAAQIIMEASQKISLKVGGSAVILEPAGVTIVGPLVKINSGGYGTETGDPSIEDPLDAAISDTGEPGWLEKHKGTGVGGGRKSRTVKSQHYVFPPRPGEPASVTALRGVLNDTATGRHALEVYERYGVTAVDGPPGSGTGYSPPDGAGGGNSVSMDPNFGVDGSGFVHEMNHAQSSNEGTAADIANQSREDYVATELAEEARGEALAAQAHDELAAAGHPEAAEPFTYQTYKRGYADGVRDYAAAHPNATAEELDRAGKEAAEKAVLDDFKSGRVPTSGPGNPLYPDYYGKAWDDAHPAPPPGP